jgi:hypothetical protein
VIPIVTGPVGTLLIAGVAIITLMIWLRRDRSYPGPRLHGEEGIDRDELERAEREVRNQETQLRPEDGFLGDDWGPGAGRPRPPERL